MPRQRKLEVVKHRLGLVLSCGEGRTLTGGWRATTQEVQINVDVFWSGNRALNAKDNDGAPLASPTCS
jgi:hypothetical protein